MRNRPRAGIVLFVLAFGAGGCGGDGASSSPSPVSQPAPSPVVQARPIVPRLPDFNLYTLSGVTLSGFVYGVTPTGQAPLADLAVYCETCGQTTHTWAYTDANGFYRFPSDPAQGGGIWLYPGIVTQVHVSREGYEDPPGLPPLYGPVTGGTGWREVLINGDTRFDIQLVRR